ncbi:hypothetical protein [Moorena sp. SIO3B2]|uniref:hypothetical protein n=1 Tax=Moorena sp. SIO3B2 TaxID=2607827 RepID=UPI0013C7A26D|nr:hypothetical protein [Moorena sp. SIO3B2]NEP36024.1 hypothetical protein [Moorena sp. SIO3B2]
MIRQIRTSAQPKSSDLDKHPLDPDVHEVSDFGFTEQQDLYGYDRGYFDGYNNLPWTGMCEYTKIARQINPLKSSCGGECKRNCGYSIGYMNGAIDSRLDKSVYAYTDSEHTEF